jgi:hypothetical protein
MLNFKSPSSMRVVRQAMSIYTSLGYLKASFIKIRNISLGYNFKSMAKAGLTNLRIYAQVQNPGEALLPDQIP